MGCVGPKLHDFGVVGGCGIVVLGGSVLSGVGC